MAFLARRVILQANGVPFNGIPAGVHGYVAIDTAPTLQVGTQAAVVDPQYYDVLDNGVAVYVGYTKLYTADMDTTGAVVVTLNNLPTGVFPHTWAGWPAAVGP